MKTCRALVPFDGWARAEAELPESLSATPKSISFTSTFGRTIGDFWIAPS